MNAIHLILLVLIVLPANAPAQKNPVFEVASIKPSPPGDRWAISRLPGGRFSAEKVTVDTLLKWAYELTDDEVSGGPKWLNTDRYDIVAVPEQNAGNEPVSRDAQERAMVRSLLRDRFQLRMHAETREIRALVLSAAQGGPKLTASTHPPGPQLQVTRKGPVRIMTFQSAPMPYVARYLSSLLKKKVVDQTHLTGVFDFRLEWTPERSPNLSAESNPAVPATADGLSLFTALQQQIGLRLSAEKVPIEVSVIDNLEKPSEN